MEWDIYSIGDPAFLAESIRAVSSIMANGDFGQLIMIGFLLGALWIAVEGIMSGAKEVKVQNLLIAGIIYFAFFGVTVDRVNIWAVDGAYMEEASDVPLGLAVSGNFISSIGKNLTEWFETEFSKPGFSTSSSGNAMALKALFKMRDIGFGDGSSGLSWDPGGRMRENLSNYVEQCVVVGTRIPEENPGNAPPLDWAKIVESDDPWEAMRFRNNLYVTDVYPYDSSYQSYTEDEPQRLGCDDAWQKINTEFVQNDDYTSGIITQLGRSVCSEEVGCAEFEAGQVSGSSDASFNDGGFEDFFRTARDTIMQSDVSLDKQLISRATMGALVSVEGKVDDLGEGDVLVQNIIDRESAQMTTSQALQGTMFERMMGPLMTYFEAFMYVMAPFAALLVTLGTGGLKMIGKYLMFALWIQLWAPVMAVANLYIQMSVSGSMARLQGLTTDAASNMGTSMESLARSYQSFEVLQHWIGTGGMLLSATPALTLMLIYGSAITASSLAGRVDAPKGADVGMDDFKGQSQVGDAKASLTAESGQVAMGNQQTSDPADFGSLSLKDAHQNALSQAQSRAQGAQESLTKSEGAALTKMNEVTAGYTSQEAVQEQLKSSEEAQTRLDNTKQQALSESSALGEDKRDMVTNSVNFSAGAGASAGADLGKKLSNMLGNDVSKNDGIAAMGKLQADGRLETANKEDWAEAVSEAQKMTSEEKESFGKAISEAESIHESVTKSDSESVTEGQSWKEMDQEFERFSNDKSQTESAQQEVKNLESASRNIDLDQQVEGAVLKAEMSDPDNLSQYQSHKGDSSAGVSDYMNDVAGAAQKGNFEELNTLLSFAGQGLGHGNHKGQPDEGVGVMSMGSSHVSQGPDQDSKESEWKDNMYSDQGGYVAPQQARDLVQNDDEMQAQSAEGLRDSDAEFDRISTDKGTNRFEEQYQNHKENLDIGGDSNAKAISEWMDSGVAQSTTAGAASGQEIGAAAGGLYGALASGTASGAVRGAVSGGVWGTAIGAAAGAAYGGYQYYQQQAEEEKQQTQNQISNSINSAGGWDKASETLDGEQKEFVSNAADSVLYEQAASIARAENNGQEWNEDEFREGLSEFDRQVFDNMGALGKQGMLNEGVTKEAEKAIENSENTKNTISQSGAF